MKNWVHWISTMQEKSHKLKNVLFGKSVKKLKNISPLMTTFYNFALKWKPVELKGSLSPFWKLEMPPMMLLCMFGLLITWQEIIKTCNVKKKSLNAQNLK